MKCLTVRQYWAWAIIHGPKRVENRTWKTSHRGRLAIHAGRTLDPASRAALETIGCRIPEDTPSGVVLGTVDLIDVVAFDPAQGMLDGLADPYGLADDPLATGPFCWILRNPQPLADPVSLLGMPGLFEVDLP